MKKSRVSASAVKSKPVSPKPNPRWGREEETEIFAKNVKLFRQGKISDDDFRRFRLQHGAYGSRLRMDYSMVRIADIGLVPAVKKSSSSPSSSAASSTSSSSSSTTTENGSETIRGFKIYLGGGLGAASFIGHLLEDFTPEDRLLATCMATIRLFDRHGNRENMARNRMRYLVHEMGWERFQKMVLKERSIVEMTTSYATQQLFDVKSHEDTRTLPLPDASSGTMTAAMARTKTTTKLPMLNGNITKDSPAFERWLHTNAVSQKHEGFVTVFITLGAGDITASQLRLLASAIRDYSAEGVARNTPQQNFALRYVRETDLANLYEKLTSAGLANPGALTIASAVGCSGTTSCNLAITNSHRLAKEVQRKFLELGLDIDDSLRDATIKISGCPNSCGQHEIATIGFFGGATRMNNTMTPTYTMLFGGSAGETGELGRAVMRVPAKRVIDTTLKIIELYKKERSAATTATSAIAGGDHEEGDKEQQQQHNHETLHQWIIRLVKGQGSGSIKNIEDMKAALAEVIQLPSSQQNPDAYRDYGSDTHFTAKTARGECAA